VALALGDQPCCISSRAQERITRLDDGHGLPRRHSAMRRLFVIVQLAVAIIVMSTASLLFRSPTRSRTSTRDFVPTRGAPSTDAPGVVRLGPLVATNFTALLEQMLACPAVKPCDRDILPFSATAPSSTSRLRIMWRQCQTKPRPRFGR